MTISDEFLERVSVGLFALTQPVDALDAKDRWRALPAGEQSKFRAKARFVLSYADDSALIAGRGR